MSTLAIGTRVRLLPRQGEEHKLRGGEGEIVGYLQDNNVVIYRVRVLRTDRIRFAARDGMTVHRSR